MSEIGAESREPRAEIVYVTVEAIAWVTQFVGGDGTRRKVFEEPTAPGATVQSVLLQVSDRFPRLRDVLWQRPEGNLGEHIEVLVNDAVLGVKHTLESQVRQGDRITLLGQFTGG